MAIVAANIGLAIYNTRIFWRRWKDEGGTFPDNHDYADFATAAKLGLYEAAKRFDPDRGVPFAGYAKHWIWKHLRLARKDYFKHRIPASLDRVIKTDGDKSRSFHEVHADAKALMPYEIIDRRGEVESLKEALQELSERERLVIVLSFGLAGDKLDQAGIASQLGCSERKVRRIKQVALTKLKQAGINWTSDRETYSQYLRRVGRPTPKRGLGPE